MRVPMSVVAAAALLLGIGTTGRAGELPCSTCAPVASCCDSCCEGNTRGLISTVAAYRERRADCCATPVCDGPRGVLNRRHERNCGDCCEAEPCKSHVRKFLEWLCYRPGHKHCCKVPAPCCYPPLYTFFTCCEKDGCGGNCHSACNSCCQSTCNSCPSSCGSCGK